jgi:hypothetical protein
LAPRCADTVGKRFALESIIQLFAERTESEAFQGNVAKRSVFTEEHYNLEQVSAYSVERRSAWSDATWKKIRKQTP